MKKLPREKVIGGRKILRYLEIPRYRLCPLSSVLSESHFKFGFGSLINKVQIYNKQKICKNMPKYAEICKPNMRLLINRNLRAEYCFAVINKFH